MENLDRLSLNDIYKLDHKDLEKQVFEIDYSKCQSEIKDSVSLEQ